MSTNTLGGINLAKIAQETLLSLEPQMFILNAFHKDFSSEVKASGESISTRVPTSMTAIDVSAGYTAANVTSTAKTVTLNQEFGFPMAFKDSEVSKAGDINYLKSVFIMPAVAAVLRKMVSTGLALVTNANYAQNVVMTTANTTYSNVVDLFTNLDLANALPNRSLLISPSAGGTLKKDTLIASMVGGGNQELIAMGNLGPVAGFNTFTYTAIPNNSENMIGIACAPQALLMAARQPAVDSSFPGEVENVIEPITGLPLQFRKFYSVLEKSTYITVEAFWGVAVGVPANLYRIKSA
jgi:hypothetical protein